MRQKVEAAQGKKDDSALNQVQFKWCKWCDWNAQHAGKALGQTSWGTWGAWTMCPKDYYITSLLMKVEGPQGSGDDTAANSMGMICRPMYQKGNYRKYKVKAVAGGGKWGTWRRHSQEIWYGYVCGGWIKSQKKQGSGDDTAFNGMYVDLCSLYRN